MIRFHRRIPILLFICLFFPGCAVLKAYAQAPETIQLSQKILYKPYHEKAEEMRKFTGRVQAEPDSTAESLIENLTQLAGRAGDQSLVLELKLLQAINSTQHNSLPLDKAIQAMQQVAEQAGQKKMWAVRTQALKQIARTWWNHQRYERMFEAFLPLEQHIKKIPSKSPPPGETRIKLQGDVYSSIAEAYFFFEDYPKAISYLKEAVALPLNAFNTREMVRAWNNMGLCYQHMEEFEKSSTYFKKIINYEPQSDLSPLWSAIAGGNLGYNYYRLGRFEEAIPLLKKDIVVSAEQEVYGEAAIAAINLIKIKLNQDRLEQAGKQLNLAQKYMNLASKDDKLHYRHEFYTVMGKWHAAMGHNKRAALYIDSTRAALETHNNNFNSLKLMRAQQKNGRQRRDMLIAERKQQLQQRNLIIVIILLLFMGSLAAYVFRNRYLLRMQQVKELELQNTSKELEHARKRLNNYTRRVKENNKLIARFKKNGRNDPEKNLVLQEIKNSTLLTDKDWIEFKRLFEQVHPGYIRRLKEAHPGLTASQIRYMVLTKLKFSRKEMAAILGISPESLRVTWYRIRKKLDLPKDTQADKLAGEI